MYLQNASNRAIRDTINARNVNVPALAACVSVRESVGRILLRRYRRELKPAVPPPAPQYLEAVYDKDTGAILAWTRPQGHRRKVVAGNGVIRSATAIGNESNVNEIQDRVEMLTRTATLEAVKKEPVAGE